MIDPDEHSDASDELLRALAQTPEVAPFTGTDRYRVETCLGEGGFGVVYEVSDLLLGGRLALKALKPHASGYAAMLRRLKREFRSVADLVHPNLVGLHELSSASGRWFITMDLVRGRDFFEHVRGDRREAPGSLSEARLRETLAQLVRGVVALHGSGLVHRDLKPPNVLVEDGGRVVILDFGLAADLDDLDGAEIYGTPTYMAPEQAAGLPAGEAADWFAVGAMLYEALAGRPPGADDGWRRGRGGGPRPPSELGPVPADLEALCLALLAVDPTERPAGDEVCEALGIAPAGRSPRRRARPSLVGREPEMARLRQSLAGVRGGEPAVVAVTGAPGIGKSALLRAFAAEVGASDKATVLTGRCHERESVPFKSFDGVIDALVGYLRELPRSEAAALLPRDIHAVARLFPAFEVVPALRDVPRRSAPSPDPRELRGRAFAALKELFARVGDKRPLVIAIDDLQWGDVDGVRLLDALLEPPDRPRMLLILAYRSVETRQSTALVEMSRALEGVGGTSATLELSPLPPNDAERLAASLREVGGAAARAIAARGEGHPLLIAELARALDDGEQLGPLSVIDVLWRRVTALSAPARDLLETVAIAGRPLAPRLCFAASGVAGEGAEAVRALRAENLVVTDDSAIDVFHDRIRDAVLSRADADRQRSRHLALARSLESSETEDFETLARHWQAGGERDRAARYVLKAAEAAMQTLAFDRAAALYRQAIEHAPESAALHQRLGDALEAAGADAAAGRAYLEAARFCDGDERIDLLRQGAEKMLQVGEAEAGTAALDQALAAVGERRPLTPRQALRDGVYQMVRLRLRGRGYRERSASEIAASELLRLDVLDSAVQGRGYHSSLDPMALGLRFRRRALAAGEPRRVARSQIYVAVGLLGSTSHRPPRFDELLDEAEAIAARVSDPVARARALRWRATSHLVYGELVRARPLFLEAAEWIRDHCIGAGTLRRLCLQATATIELYLGELEAARRIAEPLSRDAIEREDRVAEHGVAASVTAPLALAADQPGLAEQRLEHAHFETRCATTLFWTESAAGLALYRGRPGEAVQAWRHSWPAINEEGMLRPPAFRLIASRSLATALLAPGATRSELREAARLRRRVRRFQFSFAEGVAAAIAAGLALRRGRLERAAACFGQAADAYAAAEMPLDAAVCRLRLGELTGGDRGAELVADARSALASRGVIDPERWARLSTAAID